MEDLYIRARSFEDGVNYLFRMNPDMSTSSLLTRDLFSHWSRLVCIDTKLYLIGGDCQGIPDEWSDDTSKYVLMLDTTNPEVGWYPVSNMNVRRLNPKIIVKNNRIYVLGGLGRNRESDFLVDKWGEVYDPMTDTWEAPENLQQLKNVIDPLNQHDDFNFLIADNDGHDTFIVSSSQGTFSYNTASGNIEQMPFHILNAMNDTVPIGRMYARNNLVIRGQCVYFFNFMNWNIMEYNMSTNTQNTSTPICESILLAPSYNSFHTFIARGDHNGFYLVGQVSSGGLTGCVFYHITLIPGDAQVTRRRFEGYEFLDAAVVPRSAQMLAN